MFEGGTVMNEEEYTHSGLVYYGTPIVKPILTKFGYSFFNWLYENNGNTNYVSATMPASNETYRAGWILGGLTFSIDFYVMDTNGNYPSEPTKRETRTDTYQSVLTPEEIAERFIYESGTEFDAEHGETANGAAWTNETGVVLDQEGLVLTLHVKRKQYNLKWLLIDTVVLDASKSFTGGYNENKLVYYGAPIIAPTVSLPGYNLDHWYYIDENNNTKGTITDMAQETKGAEDEIITAIWKAGTYTATFDLNGGTYGPNNAKTYGPITYTYEHTTVSLPGRNDMHKTGYTFYGWDVLGTDQFYWEGYDSSGGTIEIRSLPGRDVTLKARWNALTYTITYTGMDDAAAGENAPTEHTYGTETVIPNPSKTGYAFAGWKINGSNLAVKDLTLGATDYTGDITLEATWTAGTYSVRFDANGGTGTMDDQAFAYGETKALSANQFTRTGYEFLGWSTDKNAKTAMYADEAEYTVASAADVKLYAVWEAIEYTVTYYSDGAVVAAGDNPATYTLGGEEATLVAPGKKDGYEFCGWYTTSSFKAGTEVTKLPGDHAENLTLYAKWEEDVYTISYDLGEASGVTNPNRSLTKVAKGETVTLQPASATGWIFEGWALSTDTEALARKEDGTTEHKPTDNVTYYAKWTHIQYTITYVPGEGLDNVTLTGHYNEYINAPTFTTPSGLKFLGWLKEDETVWRATRFPAEDVTLTAVWGLGDISSTEDFLAVARRSETNAYKDTPIAQTIKLKADVSVPSGTQLDLRELNGGFIGDNYSGYTITITGNSGYRPLFGSYVYGSGDGCYVRNVNLAFAESEITAEGSSATEANWGLLMGYIRGVTLSNCTVLGKSGNQSVTVKYSAVWRTNGNPSDNIGGLVGNNLGTIINCSVGSSNAYVTLSIDAQHCAVYRIGGLVGWNNGTIEFSNSACTVRTKVIMGGSNGRTDVGGLVGFVNVGYPKLTISSAINIYTNYAEAASGLLSATRGGLVGRMEYGAANVTVGSTLPTVYSEMGAELPACGKDQEEKFNAEVNTGEWIAQ